MKLQVLVNVLALEEVEHKDMLSVTGGGYCNNRTHRRQGFYQNGDSYYAHRAFNNCREISVEIYKYFVGKKLK